MLQSQGMRTLSNWSLHLGKEVLTDAGPFEGWVSCLRIWTPGQALMVFTFNLSPQR